MPPVQQPGHGSLGAPYPCRNLHEWQPHQVAQDDGVALIVRQSLDGLRQTQ